METYRQEIIETQKARSNLLQQKLIINAVLGGIGLGLRGAGEEGASGLLNNHIYLVLCLIPLVCTYVDLLCYHLNLRMFVIAKFLKDPRRAINKKKKNEKKNESNLELEDYRLYERICSEERNAFSLESFALKASSIVLSLLLIVLPFFIELDTKNIFLDDICLSISGITGIMLAILVESLSQNKANCLNYNEQNLDLNEKDKDLLDNLISFLFLDILFDKLIAFFDYLFSEESDNLNSDDANSDELNQNADPKGNNKIQKEYKRYLEKLIKIGTHSKRAMHLQNILIFCIGIFLIISSLYVNLITQYQFSNTIFLKIASDFQVAKWGFIIAISTMIIFCIGLMYLSTIICFNFKKLSELKETSSLSKNRFYIFLIEKSAKTNLNDLNAKAKKDAIYLISLLLIFIVICIVSLVFLDSIIGNVIENQILYSNVNSNIPNVLGNSIGLGGAFFIALSTLTSFPSSCFADYVDNIYKLKSFLPKELGQIQDQFVAEIKRTKKSTFIKETDIKFCKSDKNFDNDKYIYLLLIKCCQGIAIINPNEYFISSSNTTVIIDNNLNQDNLQTGSYWEIGFDFPITIGTIEESNKESQELSRDSNNNDPHSNEQKDSDIENFQKYQFQDWKKLNKDKERLGIEIGDRTALYFVYTD